MVTVYCYGEEAKWASREDAIAYYEDCMIKAYGGAYGEGCGSYEFERYFTVWANLKAGEDYAPDDDVLW